jgi:ParB family chromosome partitioning protein
MAKNTGLGRGFEALIPKEIDDSLLEEDKHRVQKLLINDIVPNPDQPRREINESALAEMARSVKQHGVLQPIIVVRDNNAYKLVAGERRWRAAKAAKLSHIPAIVRSLEELEQVELALIENIQRVDLSPLEQAMSVYRLQQQFNLSLEEIAKKLAKAPSTVSNLTRLLQLPEAAREALRKQQISEGHARAILALKSSPQLQEQLLSYILNNSWSVRQAEQFVLSAKRGSLSAGEEGQKGFEVNLAKTLSHKLKTDVKIRHTAKGGQIIISFDSLEKLQNLADKLKESNE